MVTDCLFSYGRMKGASRIRAWFPGLLYGPAWMGHQGEQSLLCTDPGSLTPLDLMAQNATHL